MSHQEPSKHNEEMKYNMRDMVADSTGVSWVDGLNGRLFYRGINIAELAHATFEETHGYY